MLINQQGDFAGMISGGCLESDLQEHARKVFEDQQPRPVSYDTQDDDDLIWGLGLGCEGVVHLLLQPLDRDYLSSIYKALHNNQQCTLALVTESSNPSLPLGSMCLQLNGQATGNSDLYSYVNGQASFDPDKRYQYVTAEKASIMLVNIEPQPRILICGAGPDAVPVARHLDLMGWQSTVVDHRPAYAQQQRFPETTQVLQCLPVKLGEILTLDEFNAAVVMSHNLEHDATYLRQLATTDLPYIGLLGPAARRQKILAKLDIADQDLKSRIHGPVGLDIGAELPEGIALAITAEIHAVLNQRKGQPLKVLS